jgi:alpha(1,3/1,4) fucosyltransferase
MKLMSPIRLMFTDFPSSSFNPSHILKLLKVRFDIDIVEHDPDYIIFSVFGCKFLEYPDAVRIFVCGENVHADFNFCDYAFGFDWLEFGDRYYRWPVYQLYEHFHEICRRGCSQLAGEHVVSQEKGFCNFLYSNANAIPYRDALFHALDSYRRVHSAGAHLNNIGYSPGRAFKDDWPRAKVEFQRGYKFSIACENSSTPGYTTEKIVHAFAADTIPIYFGNPLIAREFNPKRFVNCHDFDSLDGVVDRVAEIDQNDDLFLQIMSEPFFILDQIPKSLTDDAIAQRFAHIFTQPKPTAYRRNFHCWGPLYEALHRPRDPFADLLTRIADQLLAIVPEGARYILADEDQWAESLRVDGRDRIPFTERHGVFWGPPESDAAAGDELERHRAAGAQFMAFGSPAFWWLEYYTGFAAYLHSQFRCVLKNDRLIVFDLRDRHTAIPVVHCR